MIIGTIAGVIHAVGVGVILFNYYLWLIQSTS